MITLFKKNETNFETNGIGSLDKNIINPEISWRDNGAFTLEFRYPLFAKHGFEIENSSIIRANDPEGSNLFFVYKITPSMGYVTVLCYQISYKLAFNSINDTNIVNKNGQNALTQMSGATQYPHSFVFSSDILTTANSRVVRKNPIEFLLDSKLDNSFINRWGGHIVRHNFNIAMNSAYGSNKGYTIRHRKDLKGYEAEFDESTVITRIRPMGYDGLMLPEIYVDSPLIDNYTEPRIQQIEYSDVKVKQKSDDEEGFSTPELAYAELRRLANLEFSENKVDLPTFTCKVEFVNLKDAQEYKDLKSLKQILAGDIVKVVHSEDNFSIEAQMVEYKWNPLNQSYISITLGNYTKSFTSTVGKSLQTNLNQVAQQAQSAMNTANGKNTVYSLTHKPSITNSSVEGDLLYLKNGDKTELWILKLVNGKLQWVLQVSDATSEELKAQMQQAQTEVTEAKTAAQDAVDKANASVVAVQANTQLITDVNAIANNAKSQAQTADTNAQTALTSANTAITNANKAISDVGILSEDVSALDTIANQAKSDADTALINANKGITDAKTALDKAIGVDTRVTTEITNVNNTFATKANSKTVDAIKGTVDSQGTAISQNATDIKLKADLTVVNAIEGTVDSQGTLIEQNASDIALKANKTEVDTLTGRVSANETAIDITAQGVSTLVTKTDGTNTALSQFKQDYEGFKGTVYTKGQTDTKVSTVQQSVDNFKTAVSSTYSSKSETDNKVTAVQANVDKLGTNIAYAWSQDGKDRFTRTFGENLLTIKNRSEFISTWNVIGNTDIINKTTTTTAAWFEKIIRIQSSTDTITVSYDSVDTSGSSSGVVFYVSTGGWDSNGTRKIEYNMPLSEFKLINGRYYRTITITESRKQSFYGIQLKAYAPANATVKASFVNLKVVDGNTTDLYTPSPQDDYDNAVPRYIGRSLKDSNSPTDYKWEPNPERKPWTSYAQGLNGEGFSLMPYGENLITSALNTLNWKVDGWSGNKSFSSDGKKLIITALNGWCATRFKVPDELIGKKLTLSFNAILDGAKTTATDYTLYLANGLSGKFNTTTIANTPDIQKDKPVRYSATFVMNETGFVGVTTNNAPEISWQTTVWTIDDIKLELANTMNIPTPWTPAPSEDPLGAIPKYVGTVALPYEDPYKYDWRLSSDWNQVKTSTEFEQTDKEIALKADQTTVNTITGRVSTAEGAITTMAGQIKLKANQTDVDTVKGRVASAEGSISTMAGQVALKANQADVNTTNGKVSSLESSLTVQSGQITALNTKTDGQTTKIGKLESSYDGLVSTVANTYLTKTDATNTYPTKTSVASQITQSATAVTSDVQSWTNNKLTAYSTTQQTDSSITNAVASKADKSQITQLSNQITSVVTDVSAIQVGGQNLLLGTATAKTSTITQTNSFTTTDPYNFSVSKLSAFNFEVDDYITLSFDWETTSTTGDTRPEINLTPYGFGTVISAKGTNGATSITKTITASEQRGHIEIVFKVSSTVKVSEASKLRLRFDNHQLNSTFTIKNAKLEKGNKATDWCIAPQEVANQSQITQLSDNINLRVSKGDVTSQINLEAGRTLIDTKQLLLNANNVKFSGSAFIPNAMIQNLSAEKITAGTLNAANVNVINLNAKSLTAGTISGNNLSLNLDTGAVQFTKGYIAGNNNKIRFDLDNSYLHSIDTNGSGFKISNGQLSFFDGFFSSTPQYLGAIMLDFFSTDKSGIKVYGNKGASIQGGDYGITVGYSFFGDNKIGISGNTNVVGDLFVHGKLSVLGSKNAVHVTRDGVRATPAYETAESYLGDIGSNYTRENCEVWVDIEKLFSDTVNTDIAYHVFLQAYDDARFWVEDFRSDKFLVKSDKPMARFAWEIKAKRRGYENDRLVAQEGFDNNLLDKVHDEGAF